MTRNALARTYRPRRFAEMVTQEHVSDTLRSAVARDRVAHAYLFSGPRGVGKTTAARVLAMALNCPNRDESGEPCGTCESCERIWGGKTSLDVVEIDAASNRGVDDARDLRERAMYAPTEEERYKVYIIDEAHMLTREAWNALLKILEEPPPRVIFCFATTEPQKIQQTAPPILSRTQRFDFRRLSVPAIVERLRQVLDAEGVETDEQALLLLARRAEGGMRDALSLLDQALSFAEGRLAAEDVQRILGLVADEVYLDLLAVIAEGRVADVFRFVQEVVEGGYDLAEFYRGLTDALRTLLIVRFDGAEAAELRDDLRPLWEERAQAFSTGDLLRMLGQTAELDADGRFRKSTNPRILLEALLLRFAHLPRTVELEALIKAAGGGEATAPDARPELTPVERPAAPAETAERGVNPTATGPTASGDTAPGSMAGEPASGGSAPGSAGSAGTGSAGAGSAGTGGTASAEAAPPLGAAVTESAADPRPGTATAAAVGMTAEAAVRDVAGNGELPSGLGLFLRTARVEEADGRVVIELPAGSPALEKLESDVRTLRALQEAVSDRMGRAVELEIRPANGEEVEPTRITPDQVKDTEVKRLSEEEPALDRAVQEWDLEMLD
jgi:DNA polymerase-3 subunit gamma/tau